MKKSYVSYAAILACGLVGAHAALADDAAPASTALALPTYAGTISANANPLSIAAGPLGKVYVSGVLSGFGKTQTKAVTGDKDDRLDLSNAQLIVQTTEGLVQFYVQGGAYDTPSLGTAGLSSDKNSRLFGSIPVAFAKLVPSDSFSIYAGKLPTLIGGEYAFSFENLNIERGLLWNQENVINNGVQANYTIGPVALNAALTTGYYGDKLSYGSAAATYTINTENSAYVQAGVPLYKNKYSRTVSGVAVTSPVYNNSQQYVVGYTYNSAPLLISPYAQATYVPKYKAIGVDKATATYGAALLAAYSFPEGKLAGVSLPVRLEYITSTGSATDGSTSLIYGAGSGAYSFTVTPTYQKDIFFARVEGSYVKAESATAGSAFGSNGTSKSQLRALAEVGVAF